MARKNDKRLFKGTNGCENYLIVNVLDFRCVFEWQ